MSHVLWSPCSICPSISKILSLGPVTAPKALFTMDEGEDGEEKGGEEERRGKVWGEELSDHTAPSFPRSCHRPQTGSSVEEV